MTGEYFMNEAVRLAVVNVKHGGGPFGAVIVSEGRVISSGVNQVVELNDPTAHAEVMAIRRAAQVMGNFHLPNCQLYSSCEPCPMCLAAAYWARIPTIYFAASRRDAADFGFDDLYFYEEIQKDLPNRSMRMEQLDHDEALRAFKDWNANSQRKPY